MFSWIPHFVPESTSTSSSPGGSDTGRSPRLLLLKVVRLVRCPCPYGGLSRSPATHTAHGRLPLSVLTAVSRSSKASHHMERALKFVFRHVPIIGRFSPRWQGRVIVRINGSHECLQCVHGVKVPNTSGSLHVVAQAPPGVLLDMIQLAAQEKLGSKEPPSSLHQSEEQHGSVVLNNYVLIQLFFHNVSPCF